MTEPNPLDELLAGGGGNSLDADLGIHPEGVWAINGLRDYHANGGYAVPASVEKETLRVKSLGNPVADWIADRCKHDGVTTHYLADLLENYNSWAEVNQASKLDTTKFRGALTVLEAAKKEEKRGNRGARYTGLEMIGWPVE